MTRPPPPHRKSSQPDDADPRDAWLAKLDLSITADIAAHTPVAPIEPILLARPHPSSLDSDELLAACTLTKHRTSGPGGQHRNKVESAIRLRHAPSGVGASAGERRSAGENQRVALTRLRLHLAVLVRCPVPTGDCRSELWRTRTQGAPGRAGKIVVSPSHADYPALLAEALDVVWATGLDVKTASLRLVCTPSQWIKLVKAHPPALAWLNAHRLARGMHALK